MPRKRPTANPDQITVNDMLALNDLIAFELAKESAGTPAALRYVAEVSGISLTRVYQIQEQALNKLRVTARRQT